MDSSHAALSGNFDRYGSTWFQLSLQRHLFALGSVERASELPIAYIYPIHTLCIGYVYPIDTLYLWYFFRHVPETVIFPSNFQSIL